MTDATADRERFAGLAKLLAHGDATVIDVGANEGQFASEMLQLNPSRIYCLEPCPQAFEQLRDRFGSNPIVELTQCAIGESEGRADMYLTSSTVGSSLLRPIANQDSKWAQVVGTESVKVLRLEDFIEQNLIKVVDLLKIDTQGTDGRVLRSVGKRLKPDTVRAVLVELNFHQFYQHQDSATEIIDFLDDCGYFLAEMYRHYNRRGWLWWADGLFLPRSPEFAT